MQAFAFYQTHYNIILVSNLVIGQLIECNALCLHQNVFQQDIFDCNVYGSDKTVNDFRQ